MTDKKIPIFTNAMPGVASTMYTPNEQTVFVSAYTGNVLNGHPTFRTLTDDMTGRNPTYHGGVYVGNGQNIVSCHSANITHHNHGGYYGGGYYSGGFW